MRKGATNASPHEQSELCRRAEVFHRVSPGVPAPLVVREGRNVADFFVKENRSVLIAERNAARVPVCVEPLSENGSHDEPNGL